MKYKIFYFIGVILMGIGILGGYFSVFNVVGGYTNIMSPESNTNKSFTKLINLTSATSTYSIVPAIAGQNFVVSDVTTLLYSDVSYDDGATTTSGFDTSFSNCGNLSLGTSTGAMAYEDVSSWTCTSTANTAFGVNVSAVGTGTGTAYVIVKGSYVP